MLLRDLSIAGSYAYDPKELSADIVSKYIELRKEKLIGQTWAESGTLYIAPIGAIHGYNAREIIVRPKWVALVNDKWDEYLRSKKKGVTSIGLSEVENKKAV